MRTQILPTMGAFVGLCAATGVLAQWAPDLTPVTMGPPPEHDVVTLVRAGRPTASICVMVEEDRVLRLAVQELQECIELTTGAALPVIRGAIRRPALVIGDCPEARAAGIDPDAIPVEGFVVRTAPQCVYIVGRDGLVAPGAKAQSYGTAWGVFEFLERFVGVRWYYPTRHGGRSLELRADLEVPPVAIRDAPVFRKREIWPPCGRPSNGTGERLQALQTRLRHNNSWPVSLVVHSPRWGRVDAYREERPEVFQQRSDGSRDVHMICYGHPRTLETYLENIEAHVDRGEPAHMGIVGNAITVSPNDAAIACYCPYCRKLWDDEGGRYGTASRVLADFVARLAVEVKQRWPDMTVIYLPYQNYTMAPEGVRFPGNVEVQICGMPGLAMYKEPDVWRSEQANLEAWCGISGRPVQNWHYSCWPADRTKAPYQYVHVLARFYRENRDRLVGTFINGTEDHWPRFHVSLYCWMKLLWNPDFDVDTAVREYCRRMYGPASRTMHELVQLQTDSWEQSRWPGGRLSPKALYEQTFPAARIDRMRALLADARQQIGPDPLLRQRLDYYEAPFQAFYNEYESVMMGKGTQVLVVQKVGEQPVVDGRLDDRVWQQAAPVHLVTQRENGTGTPRYPSEVRAIWSLDGVCFGFHLHEPVPNQLVRTIRGRDDSMAWWNDNVEIFLDVTGRKEGEFYQFIINPNGAVADLKTKDATWNVAGENIGVFVGPDFWSLEVFLPYSAFPELLRPGTGVEWFGQITRHRIADSKHNDDSAREYTRMNFRFGGPSANLADFAAIRFVE